MTDKQIPHQPEVPTWLTAKQVRERYSLSDVGIKRLVDRGVLTKYRLAGNARTVRFKQSDLEALMIPDEPTEAGAHTREIAA